MESVRVRFAPSPTGFVHIGSLRTALYNYLFARKNQGKYILRVEDTDQSRFVEGAIEGMLKSMDWAGVSHNEGVVLEEETLKQQGQYGPYIQSERLPIYQEHITKLLEEGHAYHCFCSKERLDEVREKQKAAGETAKYDGHCRENPKEMVREKIEAGESYVIRLKLPENRDIEFNDIVRGKVTMNTGDLDDQVLIKSDGFPTYHFAVVVDDHLMEITHVIRGEEWLPSTPKHVYLYEVMGWQAPQYVHLPNILNTERKKLSKRQGDVAVGDFMRKGYLPEALVNYIALVGWSPEDNQEIFSMTELEENFSLERVSKSGGVFDVNKLNWINNHYIKESTADRIVDLAIPYLIEAGYVTEAEVGKKYDWLKDLVGVLKERLDYVADIVNHVDIFFKTAIEPKSDEAREILKEAHLPELLEAFLEKVEAAEVIDDAFGKKALKEIQKEKGFKGPKLFKPIRVALTGEEHGPDLPLIIKVLGKENLKSRIQYVKEHLI
ncbi:glutamyl-tRNA synthetase [Alkaliphilus metalliredigens QYMF]|uniref:Glutamate--tRNA ligase n=1 Tax=Alkaliphilus metalliredigens (strain QYMF) TaxID=293826 RepID=SYE_ALKMQ|nr:glutamate--tRNA ligase [Alkaliphilus metalliredigens]A6TWK7.1 RecName: Full=Glutamate--tRNA ligase; AltName: Full=Glutamyl-tRNA synthetase; Short=GluRS [Alkaliphilus metalliredigens QYMF]ABR50575.1 glutamyl-tRNA synthetase [Alkaliphilus metalliredigens QYMF]